MCGRRDRTGEGAQVGRDRQRERERGGFKCQVTWKTLVLFCFVSRAWSFKNSSLSESAERRNTTLHTGSLYYSPGV